MSDTILTGQQIGLLGGPLYTTYKVLGAARLARETGGKAVFWLETNDADFQEINRVDYLDGRGKLKSLEWNKQTRGLSVGHVEVDHALVSLLNSYFDSLRQTEFTPGLRDIVLNAYSKGRPLGDASVALARALYGFLGIAVFDPRDPGFLNASRGILLREAERTPVGRQCNLFAVRDKKRIALFRGESGFHDRRGRPVALEAVVLVPNVKTRNLIQDNYFRTRRYVAGPSEVRYIAELDEMYRFHGVSKPEVVKRMSVVLVEPKVRRLLRKLGLDIGDILGSDKETFSKKALKKYGGFDYRGLRDSSDRLAGEFLKSLDGLGLDVREIRQALYRVLGHALGKLRSSHKERVSETLERIHSLFDYLAPHGKPQERVFNLIYYLNLYGGTGFVNWLADQYDWDQSVLEIKNET